MLQTAMATYICSSLCFCTSANTHTYYSYFSGCKSYAHIKSVNDKPIIGVIGTGYVGLVTGAGLAEYGNRVICADIDATRISLLQRGIIPIYEPGLHELVMRNIEQEKISFSNDVIKTLELANIIFIAVDTPRNKDGSANLDAINTVIDAIGKTIDKYTIIVVKSTVPIGTGAYIREVLEHVYNVPPTLFSIVSNPEFLREGTAVQDVLEPDRLVIGIESAEAYHTLCIIYQPLLSAGVPCVCTDIVTAEIIKYASNAFLAVKLSFINEIANLCDMVDGNAQTVAYAMGLDHRISPHFLKPGPGYGGSCFPKDTEALIYTAHTHQVQMHTVQGAIETNTKQRMVPVNKLIALYKPDTLQGKTVAVLGLSFKANTDDIRYSPSITAIQQLQQMGVIVKAYDPKAMYAMSKLLPMVQYCDSAYEAVTGADAAIIMTEWDEFRHLDITRLASLMRNRIMVDARNVLNAEEMHLHGFLYDGIGQGTTKQKN
jgi:UDPglucose 6-dehydrogenase